MSAAAPIETVFGPVLITRTGPWVAFRLNCRSYASEPERERQAMVDELESYAFSAEADFQLLRCFRRWDAEAYAERLRRRTPRGAHRELYRRVLSLQQQALERIEPRTPMVFLCVRLADPKLDAQERAARVFEHDPKELVASMRGKLRLRSRASLDPRALADIHERAQAAQARVFDHLDAELARTDELQWLICQGFCRALGEPEIPGMDRPQALSPVWGDVPRVVPEHGNVLRWLAEHGVERHSRYLKVASELGDSYQAGLCLGEMRHAPAFSRQCELLFSALEEYSFALDACLNVRWVPNAQALRRSERQLARTAHQLADEEQASVAGAKDRGYDRVALAHEAHSRLSETGEPWLEGTLSLICSAPSPEELERRVKRVRKGFPHPLYRPHGDQLEIFLAHLPGQRCRVAGFERVFTCEQVGAMVPQATHQAGSESGRGLYVARSFRGRHPVLIDLREASGTDQSPLIALIGSLGGGKALADDTPIPTPTGWRLMSEVEPGDQVFDETGEPCTVSGVYPQPQGRECYEVCFSDGSSIIADAEHRWATVDLDARKLCSRTRTSLRQAARRNLATSRYRGVKRAGDRWLAYHGHAKHTPIGLFDRETDAARAATDHRLRQLDESQRAVARVRTTTEIRDSLHRHGQLNHAVPVAGALQYREQHLPIPPYTLGAWLGDGSSGQADIWTDEPEIVENIRSEGCVVKKLPRRFGYRLLLSEHHGKGQHGVAVVLKRLGVLRNKHIPEPYLQSSEQQRRALLAGLLDTDGTVSPDGQVHYGSTCKALADNVLELVLSLGYRASVTRKRAKLNGGDCGASYRVRFTTDDDVFRLERKRTTLRDRTAGRHSPERTKYRYITEVRAVPSRPVRCISVDSANHLYLCGRQMIPTHNTLTLQYLEYLAFAQGARVVDVDPKGDHRLHQLRELEGHSQAIVLGPDPEHRGKLDPLRVAPSEERHEAAASFLSDVIPTVNGTVISAINGAVGRVIEAAEQDRRPELACCMRVVETLEHGELEQEREAAYHLRQYCESGFAQLGFASVSDPLPQQASEQFTYLQIKALKRSHVQTVRSEMTQAQRHSSAVLQLVALYAMRILGEERERLKVLGFDEASFMAADAVGQQLLDTLARWGRSELAVPILSTQLIEDIDAQDNLVGQYLLFGMRSPREAAKGLELLGLDPGDRAMVDKLVKRYRAGRALYRDLQGRCEEIKVDLKDVDPGLFEALRTTPAEEETFDDRDRDVGDEQAA